MTNEQSICDDLPTDYDSIYAIFQATDRQIIEKLAAEIRRLKTQIEPKGKPYGWVWEWPDGQRRFVAGEECPGDKWIPLYREAEPATPLTEEEFTVMPHFRRPHIRNLRDGREVHVRGAAVGVPSEEPVLQCRICDDLGPGNYCLCTKHEAEFQAWREKGYP